MDREAYLRTLRGAFRQADTDKERGERVADIRKMLVPVPEPGGNPDLAAVAQAAEAPEAEWVPMLEAHFSLLRPLVDTGEPEPPPVLWHDNGNAEFADAVLSVGEVAVLSGPGSAGKSTVTLSLALAAVNPTEEDEHGNKYGEACGLRIRPGPVVLVSYEDAPVRIVARLKKMSGGKVPAGILVWPSPAPLFEIDDERRAVPCRQWPALWDAIREIAPSMVIVDPVSAAMDASTNDGGFVRSFMRKLATQADRVKVGVLLVAHDTKQARAEAAAGGRPGPGAVAGSATWYDAARGVLHLAREANTNPDEPLSGRRTLRCEKANYGRSGWTVKLEEDMRAGRFVGFKTADAAGPAQDDDDLEAEGAAYYEKKERKSGARR